MFKLAPNLAEQYLREGFVKITKLIDLDIVDRIKHESSEILSSQRNTPTNNRFRRWKGVTEAERIDPIIDLSPTTRMVSLDPRLIELVMTLINGEPQLYKDSLVLKPPGAGGYDLHQDYTYFPYSRPENQLSICIAIDPLNVSNGGTYYLPEMHHQSYISGKPRSIERTDLAKINPTQPVTPRLEPGDAVVFNSMTPHGSKINLTNKSRRALYLSYNLKHKTQDTYKKQLLEYRRVSGLDERYE